ncbi:MAG: glycosyltransferase family 4 protein [Endomicrobium sp.]|nr:glycosyltransferase family 4 protein [Endomicrobium sp.]
MLKICYIITKLELGGAQKVALYTAERLDKDKFSSFFITGKGGILDGKAAQKFKLFQLDSFVREIRPLKDIAALFGIYKILKKEKPNIVHTHSSKAGILGRIAAKLAGVKTVIHTIHGYGFNETQKWHIKYFFILVEKFCALFSDKLIAVAEEDIKKGLRYKIAKEDKFVLIRAGIDVNYYKNYKLQTNLKKSLNLSDNAKIVTTIGPFKPQKNLKDFIKAAEIAGKNVSEAVFLITGDGDLRKRLEEQISKTGMKDKIILLGWRDDIAEILTSSDIFVMTSLWEGLPRAIIEAMCCAKPVIANAVDGVKEIISEGKNGYKIQPYDYGDTAQKIIKLLQNDALLKEMSAEAQSSITEEFDINYTVRQQEELYLK